MAEEAEKNREIVEGLKASMVKLSSKVNSRSNDLGKQFQGVKEQIIPSHMPIQSVHSDQ